MDAPIADLYGGIKYAPAPPGLPWGRDRSPPPSPVTRAIDPLGIVLRALVGAYRWVLSPLLGPRCRHLPTCSEYAQEALERFGGVRGDWLALRRVLRCHPWGTSGYDPVPQRFPGFFAPHRAGREHHDAD